jgi:hypothetical protein
MDLYCDYCEREGHAFRSCPKRDDDEGWDLAGAYRDQVIEDSFERDDDYDRWEGP